MTGHSIHGSKQSRCQSPHHTILARLRNVIFFSPFLHSFCLLCAARFVSLHSYMIFISYERHLPFFGLQSVRFASGFSLSFSDPRFLCSAGVRLCESKQKVINCRWHTILRPRNIVVETIVPRMRCACQALVILSAFSSHFFMAKNREK